MTPVEILLVSGSLRSGSVNTAVLRTAAAIAPPAVRAVLYEGLGELPHFNPDEDPEGAAPPGAVADLRARLARADAILYCTPEYAGALPGSFKNLLDWTVGGGETYGKPAAWINVTSRPDDVEVRGAYESLRAVLGYTGADIVEAACRRIRVTRAAIGPDGLVAAAGVREEIAAVLHALAARVAQLRDGTASAEAAAREALQACDRAFFRALVERDVHALEQLLASDFLIVDVGSGGVHAREELLEALRRELVVFEAIEEHPEDAVTRREGDVAITVGRTSMSMSSAGAGRARIDSRYTHVFRASDGHWQLISAQGTPIRG